VVDPSPDNGLALRSLPQVDRLSTAIGDQVAPRLRVRAARRAIADAGSQIRAGSPAPEFDELVARARGHVDEERRRRLMPVINASGVLLHTNLGRAPLSTDALAAIQEVSLGYSNLEFDLAAGRRGSRYGHASDALMVLTGASAALVVNNNASAVLLAVAALAGRGEVIVSRGELIEIGGEFRIPDIIAQSGAVMREVGTTNRTHRKDYERAITDQTAAILKIHPSNYEVVGFTASVAPDALAELAQSRGVPLIYDVGSGLLSHRVGGRSIGWLAREPSVAEAVKTADVVTFSGDKLLGGPQAGILVGTAPAIAAMRESPLLRAMRVDKLTLAALDATLDSYLRGEEAELPVWRMALLDPESIRSRAEAVIDLLDPPEETYLAEVVEGFSTTGGGSAPGSQIPTCIIKVTPRRGGPAELTAALLAADPPVVTRQEEGSVLLDLRTAQPEQDGAVASALSGALARSSPS
jgi:L-seryl-tRNA(Ser) seleniumtransferase